MKYDAILYLDNTINESIDDRVGGYGLPSQDVAVNGIYRDYDDPKLFNMHSYGNIVRDQLNDMGRGFSCTVTDFNKWVVVDVKYNNVVTGRSASKTFLIVFKPEGTGLILNTANKYRTINGVSQAISYIKSSSSILKNSTQSKL